MRIWSFFCRTPQSRWHNSSQGSLGMFRLWCTHALCHLIWRSCVYIVILSCIPIPFKWNLHNWMPNLPQLSCETVCTSFPLLHFNSKVRIIGWSSADGPKKRHKKVKSCFFGAHLDNFYFCTTCIHLCEGVGTCNSKECSACLRRILSLQHEDLSERGMWDNRRHGIMEPWWSILTSFSKWNRWIFPVIAQQPRFNDLTWVKSWVCYMKLNSA